jgi:hypothetical protein
VRINYVHWRAGSDAVLGAILAYDQCQSLCTFYRVLTGTDIITDVCDAVE